MLELPIPLAGVSITVAGPPVPKRSVAERFRNGWDLVGECWIWRGAKSEKGYARFRDGSGGKVSVHRFAYEAVFGPIPPGLVIDHLCGNRACCNPNHLEAVTNAENTRRGARGKVKSTMTHCLRGHEFTPENTWYDRYESRRCRECMRIRDRKYAAQRRAKRR